MTIRIMFVCSGNICRTPMAVGLARPKLAEAGVEAVVVSCGTLNIIGQPAAALGQVAMKEIGIDIGDHYSQGVQRGMLDAADYIIVMAPKHEAYLRRVDPGVADRIVRMWEWTDDELAEIADPIGKDIEAFRECRELLDRCIVNWLASLERP